MAHEELDQRIMKGLLELQILIKKAELYGRHDLSLNEIQRLCDVIDKKFREVEQ